MLTTLLILSSVAALFYLLLLFLPSQRAFHRFIYNTHTSPAALNGAFTGDDITHPAAPDPSPWPAVTVIVPGRNEGHLLAATLGSLCTMDYPHFRVVFIDDQSTDNTAAVCRDLEARHPHLTVLHNTQPPRDGWIGKTWAVHQAEPHMHAGDYLLFTDADLEFHPLCLKQMVRLARHRKADVASLLPAIRCETFGELLGMLTGMLLINIRLPLYAGNDPAKPMVLVAGGFFLVKRDVYHALGGHAAVRGQVIEDVAFGTRAKTQGRRVFTALTHDLYTARMYEGWRDTYRGLKKNSYAGANYNPLLGIVVLAVLLFLGTFPPLYAAAGLSLAALSPSPQTFTLAASGLIAFTAQLLVGLRTARDAGMKPRTAWTLPLGFLFYTFVFLGSALDHYRGGNTWAGRRITNPQTLAQIAKNLPPP